MKNLRFISLLAALLSVAGAADTGFKAIFNGRDLTGWEGYPQFWSVKDGAITGQTTLENPLKKNTFLIWKAGEVANFELRAAFKLTGQNDKKFANSGVQYRSRIVEAEGFVVGGYQMDMDLGGQYIGMLYEERGRGILMQPGQTIRITGTTKDDKGRDRPKVDVVSTQLKPEEIRAAYKSGEWNQLVIIAEGNHVRHFINGKLTADVTDADAAHAPKSGVLALQLHTGGAMTVQFKDLQLKTLP